MLNDPGEKHNTIPEIDKDIILFLLHRPTRGAVYDVFL